MICSGLIFLFIYLSHLSLGRIMTKTWQRTCPVCHHGRGLRGSPLCRGRGGRRRSPARDPRDSESQQYHLVAASPAAAHRQSFGNVEEKKVFHASVAYPACPSGFYPSAVSIALHAGRRSEALKCIYFYFQDMNCCCLHCY